MIRILVCLITIGSLGSLGCGSQLLGIGDDWTKKDCAKLDLVTFASSFVCKGDDEVVCRSAMLAGHATAMAICLGLSDEDPEPVEPEEEA